MTGGEPVSTVATEATPAQRRSPAPRLAAPRRNPKQRNWLTIWSLMLPAIIALIALIAVPVYKMVVLSFQKPNLFTHKRKYVYLKN